MLAGSDRAGEMRKNHYDTYTLADLLAENKAGIMIYIAGYAGGQKKELWLNYDEGAFTDDIQHATVFDDWKNLNGIYSYLNAAYVLHDLGAVLDVHTVLKRDGRMVKYDVFDSMLDTELSLLLPEERKMLQEAGYKRCGKPLVIERKKNARSRKTEARPGRDCVQPVPSMEGNKMDMPQPGDKPGKPV